MDKQLEELYGLVPEGMFSDVNQFKETIDSEGADVIYGFIPDGMFSDVNQFKETFSSVFQPQEELTPEMEETGQREPAPAYAMTEDKYEAEKKSPSESPLQDGESVSAEAPIINDEQYKEVTPELVSGDEEGTPVGIFPTDEKYEIKAPNFDEYGEKLMSGEMTIKDVKTPEQIFEDKILKKSATEANRIVTFATVDLQKAIDKSPEIQEVVSRVQSKYQSQYQDKVNELQALVNSGQTSEEDANAELQRFSSVMNNRISDESSKDPDFLKEIGRLKSLADEDINKKLASLQEEISIESELRAKDKIQELGAWEGLGNAIQNEWTKTKMLPSQAGLYAGQISEDVEGDGKQWTLAIDGDGVSFKEMTNKERQIGNYNDVKQYEEQMKDVLPIIESYERGNYAKAASGAVSNAIQFMGSIARAIPTLGSSAVYEMGTPMYIEAVEAEAKRSGLTPEEVIANDTEDEITAMALGTMAGALETVGIGKAVGFAKNKIFKDALEEGVKKNKTKIGREIWDVLKTSAIEAETEVTQGALEEANKELQERGIKIGTKGAGKTIWDNVRDAVTLSTDESRETAVATFLGSALMLGGGRGAKLSLKRGESIKVDGKQVSQEDFQSFLDNATDEQIAAASIEVKGSDELKKTAEQRKTDIRESAIIKRDLAEAGITDDGRLSELIPLEKEKKKLQGNTTEAGKKKLQEVNSKIAEVMDKKSKSPEYSEPTVNTNASPDDYATVNRNDGKGSVKLTEAEYKAEMEGFGTNTESTKTQQDGIQEQGTDGVDVQESTAGSPEVGGGDVREGVSATEGKPKAKTTTKEEVQPVTEAEYASELKRTKESDPEQYWSVDAVTEADAKKGTVVEVEGGFGLVGQDGDVKGVFKTPESKEKGVADKILQKAIEVGATKLDNFDGYLTKIYERNGFRVVSRIPFNEEYAPDGWNKEKHGTPDVVAMVYDPNKEIDIEEKRFEDYDEGIAYRDSVVPSKSNKKTPATSTKRAKSGKVSESETNKEQSEIDAFNDLLDGKKSPKFKKGEDSVAPSDYIDIEQATKDMNALDPRMVEYDTPETDTGIEVDPIAMSEEQGEISQEVLDHYGVKDVKELVKRIEEFNGIPMVRGGMTDPLAGGTVNDSMGNPMEVQGGVMFSLKNAANKFLAWAGIDKKGAGNQYKDALDLYKKNQGLFERLWKDGKLPYGHVPMTITRMGNDGVNSNEAVFRFLSPKIKSFPVANRKAAFKEAVLRLKGKKATVSKTGKKSFTAGLNEKRVARLEELINKYNVETLDGMFDAIADDALNRSKDKKSIFSLDDRGAIFGILMSGEGVKTHNSDVATALFKGTDADTKLFTSDYVYESISEKGLKDTPKGHVVAIVGIDVLDGGVIKATHNNYGYGPKGRMIALISNPKHQVEVFPEQKARAATQGKLKSGKDGTDGKVVRTAKEILGMATGPFFNMLPAQGQTVQGSPTDAQSMIGLLRLAFPSVQAYTSKEEFASVLKEDGVREHIVDGEVILGLTKDGKIYINPDIKSVNTPIHEFGHIWVDMLRSTKDGRALLKKGLSLVDSDPKAYEAAKAKYAKYDSDGNITNDELVREEALVSMIAAKGEGIVDAAQKSNFKNWLKAVVEYAKKHLRGTFEVTGTGTKKERKSIINDKVIKNLTLEQFMDMGLADLLSGELTPVQPKVDAASKSSRARLSKGNSIKATVKLKSRDGNTFSRSKEFNNQAHMDNYIAYQERNGNKVIGTDITGEETPAGSENKKRRFANRAVVKVGGLGIGQATLEIGVINPIMIDGSEFTRLTDMKIPDDRFANTEAEVFEKAMNLALSEGLGGVVVGKDVINAESVDSDKYSVKKDGDNLVVTPAAETPSNTRFSKAGVNTENNTIHGIIRMGRENGISDNAIEAVLIKRGYDRKSVKSALAINVDLTTKLPDEFRAIGAVKGLELFNEIQNGLRKFIKKGKKTNAEIREKAMDLLLNNETFKAQSPSVQEELAYAYDRALGTKAGRNIQDYINTIKNNISQRKKGVKSIKEAQKDLKRALKAIPMSKDVQRIITAVGRITPDNVVASVELISDLIDSIASKDATIAAQKDALRDVISGMREDAKYLAEIKKELRRFINSSLPITNIYTKGELGKIASLVAKINSNNIEEMANKVLDMVDAKREQLKKKRVKSMLDLARKKAKKARTTSSKPKSSGIDAQGQVFFKEVAKVLKMAYSNDFDGMIKLAQELSDLDKIDAILAKEANGEQLTLKEQVLLDRVAAFDTFADVMSMSLEEVENLFESLVDVRKESIVRLNANRAARAKEMAELDFESNEQIKEGFSELYNSDGSLKNANKIAASQLSIYEQLKRNGIIEGGKKILSDISFDQVNVLKMIKELFTQNMLHLGTIMDLLDKGGTFFKDNIYEVLNVMDEAKNVGMREQRTKLDELANSINGVKDGYKSIKKLLKGEGMFIEGLESESRTDLTNIMNDVKSGNMTMTVAKQRVSDIVRKRMEFVGISKKDIRAQMKLINSELDIEKLTNEQSEYLDELSKVNGLNGVTMNKDGLLRLYALSKNGVQLQKMKGQGLTDQKLQEIKDFLGPELIEFADNIVDYLSNDYFESVNGVYVKTNDVNLDYIENYFPTKSLSGEKAKPIDPDSFQSKFDAESPSSLKARIDEKSGVNFNYTFIGELDNHIESMERYKAMAEGVKKISKILSLEQVNTLLKETGFDRMVHLLIDNVVNPVTSPPSAVSWFANKFVGVTLGFKLMQLPKQATSFVNAFSQYSLGKEGSTLKKAGMIGPDLAGFMYDMTSVIFTLRSSIREARKMSATFDDRARAALEGDMLTLESGIGNPSQKSEFSRIWNLMKASPTTFGDIVGVMGYMAVYNRNIKNGMSQEKALAQFNDYNKTQQTRRGTELSVLQVNAKQQPLLRLVTMFGSTMILQLNEMISASAKVTRDFKNGNPPSKSDVRSLYLNAGIANVLFITMANAFKLMDGDDEDKEEVYTEMFKAMVMINQLQKVPLLGTAIQQLTNKIQGKRYNVSSSIVPTDRLVGQVIKSVEDEDLGLALQSITEFATGTNLQPFLGAGKIATGEYNDEVLYDLLGVSSSYQPKKEKAKKETGLKMLQSSKKKSTNSRPTRQTRQTRQTRKTRR